MKDRFQLLKPWGGHKAGKIFESFGGLVRGIKSESTKLVLNFDNTEFFKRRA